MLEPGRPLGWLDALATLVTVGAVLIELVADNQLRDYTLHRKRPGETMTEGIWAWSRHPNYFGEITFWWGIWLFGVAAVGLERWWMVSGALAITLLFNFISVPMIERRMLARRADYRAVQARVSRLVPWFPRR
jgi:steroid 5-alpha reductase family enzyme